MVASNAPAPRWVAWTQAMVAREMVEQLGVPARRTAQLLGTAPSAVSQYLRGHRHRGAIAEIGSRPDVALVVHRAAVSVAETPAGRSASPRLVLDAAAALAELVQKTGPTSAPPAGRIDRATVRQLHDRVATEQAAVSDCMLLAQKARDELTRAVFRQIASDSLRHAEIVASLAVYVESGSNHSFASGIERPDIQHLMQREKEAESRSSGRLRTRLGGVMKLLAESMAADERKHERLLEGLLREGFSP